MRITIWGGSHKTWRSGGLSGREGSVERKNAQVELEQQRNRRIAAEWQIVRNKFHNRFWTNSSTVIHGQLHLENEEVSARREPFVGIWTQDVISLMANSLLLMFTDISSSL